MVSSSVSAASEADSGSLEEEEELSSLTEAAVSEDAALLVSGVSAEGVSACSAGVQPLRIQEKTINRMMNFFKSIPSFVDISADMSIYSGAGDIVA